jgi:hypothetical protein
MDWLHQAIVWLFVTINAARTAAYAPQIWSALRSRDGARGISTITWGYFALSHFIGGVYSLHIAHDAKLAGAFLGNFVACSVLLGVVCWRRQHRSELMVRRPTSARRRIADLPRQALAASGRPEAHKRQRPVRSSRPGER